MVLFMYFNTNQDRLFRGCSRMRGWGAGCKKALPVPKICHTYPAMLKLGTVIPYLKKIKNTKEGQKNIWVPWRTLKFCWYQHFLPKITIFCYIKKYRCRLHFDSFNFYWVCEDCLNKHSYNFDDVNKNGYPRPLRVFEIQVVTS